MSNYINRSLYLIKLLELDTFINLKESRKMQIIENEIIKKFFFDINDLNLGSDEYEFATEMIDQIVNKIMILIEEGSSGYDTLLIDFFNKNVSQWNKYYIKSKVDVLNINIFKYYSYYSSGDIVIFHKDNYLNDNMIGSNIYNNENDEIEELSDGEYNLNDKYEGFQLEVLNSKVVSIYYPRRTKIMLENEKGIKGYYYIYSENLENLENLINSRISNLDISNINEKHLYVVLPTEYKNYKILISTDYNNNTIISDITPPAIEVELIGSSTLYILTNERVINQNIIGCYVIDDKGREFVSGTYIIINYNNNPGIKLVIDIDGKIESYEMNFNRFKIIDKKGGEYYIYSSSIENSIGSYISYVDDSNNEESVAIGEELAIIYDYNNDIIIRDSIILDIISDLNFV